MRTSRTSRTAGEEVQVLVDQGADGFHAGGEFLFRVLSCGDPCVAGKHGDEWEASSQFRKRDHRPSVALATHAGDVQVQRRVLFGRHRLVRVPHPPRQDVGARISQDLLLRRPFREEVPVPQVVDLDVLDEQAGFAIAVAFTLVANTVRASCACAGRRRGRRCGTGRRRGRSSSGAFVLGSEAGGDRGCIRAR